jgi:hypothetical protein
MKLYSESQIKFIEAEYKNCTVAELSRYTGLSEYKVRCFLRSRNWEPLYRPLNNLGRPRIPSREPEPEPSKIVRPKAEYSNKRHLYPEIAEIK